MSAPAGPRYVAVKSDGFTKLTGKEAAGAEELFIDRILKDPVKFRRSTDKKVFIPTEKQLRADWSIIEMCPEGQGANASKSEPSGKNSLRVDNEADISAGFPSVGTSAAYSGNWQRWDAQKGGKSAGSIMVPIGHWVEISQLPTILVNAAIKGERYCVWQPGPGGAINIKGVDIAISPDAVPTQNLADTATAPGSKNPKGKK